MSNSLHFGFRQAFKDRLEQLPEFVDGGIKTGKRRPMPAAVNAQVFVDIDDSPATPVTLGNAVEWATRIRVEVLARDADAERADIRADAYMTEAYERVMSDPYFGGLALQTDPAGIAWRIDDEAETGLSACVAVFSVRHRTPRASVAA